MDTEYDFISPEFMHLLFFKQKNLVIYPHVDVKHLRGLETFSVGYTMVDMECTALYNFKEVLKMPSDGSHSNFYLIYGLNKENASELLELERTHCILNVSESMTDIMSEAHDSFIFYNKKTGKFLNYNFDGEELKFEHMLISMAKDPEGVKTELLKIKNVAHRLYKSLNIDPEHVDVTTLFKDYNEEEYPKILEFTANFYDISIPDNILEQKQRFNPENTKRARFFEEFKAITSVNQKLTDELIKMLHDYKQSNINQSNLELEELHTPMLLYNYLRKHHWEKGVPLAFFKRWPKMEHTQYQLNEDDLEDYRVILKKRGLTKDDLNEVLSSIDLLKVKGKPQPKKEPSDPISKSVSRKRRPVQDAKPDIDDVPLIPNIGQFKKEVFAMLDDIESDLQK